MTSSTSDTDLQTACDIIEAILDGDDFHGTEIMVFMDPPSPDELTEDDEVDEYEDEYEPTIRNFNKNQLRSRAEIQFIGETDSESETNEAEYSRRLPRKKKPRILEWNKEDFSKSSKFPSDLFSYSKFENMSPVKLFELFFDENLLDLIVLESNQYAIFKGWPNLNITIEDIKLFLAILIISSYDQQKTVREYWSNDNSLRNEAIYKSMRRNRFEQIMKCLHFAPNVDFDSNDKFYKLRPLIAHLQAKFMELFVPEESICHGQAMVANFKRKNYYRVNRKSTPLRFGYKVWCQNSPTGFLVAFEPSQGKHVHHKNITGQENEKKFGKCPATVLQLIEQHYKPEIIDLPFHFYIGNLFTTIPLLFEMIQRGYNCTGEIRPYRIESSCPLSSVEKFNKETRGYMEVCTAKLGNDKVAVNRWTYNNTTVTVASTSYGQQPIGSVQRYLIPELKKVSIPISNCIEQYNTNMGGGTNRIDQNLNEHRIAIRGNKWWWSLFTWLLDAAINNAWVLHTSSGGKLSQLEFRCSIAMHYIKSLQNPPKKPGRKSKNNCSIENVIRLDGKGHLVRPSKRRRCAGKGCSSVVQSECCKCNVGICFKCNVNYHTKL